MRHPTGHPSQSSTSVSPPGHFSDTYKVVILESGLGYIAARDPRPGCELNHGRHMAEGNRRVTEQELLPALRAAVAHRGGEPACLGPPLSGGDATANRSAAVAAAPLQVVETLWGQKWS